MVADNVPEAHSNDSCFGWFTPRILKKQVKFCVELVGMLKDFLNNPPAPVSVFECMNATVSEDEVRFAFFEASNMQAAAEYMAGSERIILFTDCTYQTNHQRLVLGSLGLAVLHKDVSNIFLDGHAGALAAMQRCFPGACIHRDLQHVKKNIKDNACKLQDRNLKTYITVVEFSAKLSQPSEFHTVWKDTLGRLPQRVGRGVSPWPLYLEENILDKSSRRWYGARWQSGLGSICIGYTTYTSNSQEKMWRTLKGILPKDGSNLDLGDLVHNAAQLLLTWTRAGQFANVFFRLEMPLPVHLHNKGSQLMSEPDVDPSGIQHRRLSATQMRDWLEERGAQHTYLKEDLDGARVLIDGRTKAVEAVYVLPKY
ncbi:unnamed protein product [Symbiodinium sp. CCMP2592]|nr:unnamed protein product [Symbiodinium sp. CCMP2592]